MTSYSLTRLISQSSFLRNEDHMNSESALHSCAVRLSMQRLHVPNTEASTTVYQHKYAGQPKRHHIHTLDLFNMAVSSHDEYHMDSETSLHSRTVRLSMQSLPVPNTEVSTQLANTNTSAQANANGIVFTHSTNVCGFSYGGDS